LWLRTPPDKLLSMIDYDSHNWRDHLLDIRGSMVRQIFYRVLTCVAWSVAVTVVHEERYLPLAVSPVAHTLIGVALGLLLVFRTNASYDRFWEGRKLWGAIVNDTRNLARAASVQLTASRELVTDVIQWTIAFPYAAMYRLRGQSSLGPAAADLPEEEVQSVVASNHAALAVSQRISSLLLEARQQGLISDYVQMSIDQYVARLVDSLGGCERIHNTPLPFAYVVHLRRALIAYCFTLPFALLEPFGWLTVPVTLLIGYTLYGIEEIGVEIEDPFGQDDNDLPLDQICQRIETNLKGLLATRVDESAIELPSSRS
jgi:putative membrane protein